MRVAVMLSLAGVAACGAESVEVPPAVDAPFTALTGGLSFAQLANGGTFTCGIRTTDSSAYCWGWAYDGELGSRPIETCVTPDGVEPCRRAPVAVGGGLRFMAISAGARHVCAL